MTGSVIQPSRDRTASAPVIGWQSESPVPDRVFNSFLTARNGRLFLEDLELAQLFVAGGVGPFPSEPLPSPLEIAYLPKVRQQIADLNQLFAEVIETLGYDGQFHYAYASKANTAEEIVRTALVAGAHHEMSSRIDVDIARIMHLEGLLPSDRMVIANGFKSSGTEYSRSLIEFKALHSNLIPVIEDRLELAPLLESGLEFDVGLRQKSYGHHLDERAMDSANSRFGLQLTDLWRTADEIAAAPPLNLKLYHAMIGSQITDEQQFVDGLRPMIDIFARLRQQHPQLSIFDFGGGLPVATTLDFRFDYRQFALLLLKSMQEVCGRYGVPVPDIMGELGRYTAAAQGTHLFEVTTVKENGSALPWYIIDGSIMTSFPDTWALGEHFIVLPLNHLDKPFRRVQLGGITCDSDDIYPPRGSRSPLYLPVETDDLYIGFFCVGAYQEMLGGVRGSKHCVLPEASELIVERSDEGGYDFQLIPGQTTEEVLANLGYRSNDSAEPTPHPPQAHASQYKRPPTVSRASSPKTSS